MQTIDEDGQVVSREPQFQQAADGAVIPYAAMTGGDFINQLEDGQLSQDMFKALGDIAAAMNDASLHAGKAKGKLVITIDLTKEDQMFRIASKMKVTLPEPPRPKSVMWADEHNRFTRFPPNQMQMFGLRAPGGSGGIRNV